MNSGNPAKTHIAPERLWQSACGGAELQSSEYLHLVGCVSCDKLADEIASIEEELATIFDKAKELLGRAQDAASALADEADEDDE